MNNPVEDDVGLCGRGRIGDHRGVSLGSLDGVGEALPIEAIGGSFQLVDNPGGRVEGHAKASVPEFCGFEDLEIVGKSRIAPRDLLLQGRRRDPASCR